MRKRFVDFIKSKRGHVNIRLTLLSFIDPEDGKFIFHSPALDLYGYGDTEDQAKVAFESTLQLYIDFVTEEKTLEKDLNKLGWTSGQIK